MAMNSEQKNLKKTSYLKGGKRRYRFTMRTDDETMDAIEKLAEYYNRSNSDAVRRVIIEAAVNIKNA